jgi:hypothetical protein
MVHLTSKKNLGWENAWVDSVALSRTDRPARISADYVAKEMNCQYLQCRAISEP